MDMDEEKISVEIFEKSSKHFIIVTWCNLIPSPLRSPSTKQVIVVLYL